MISAVYSSPPSTLVPYSGPHLAGQVVKRMTLGDAESPPTEAGYQATTPLERQAVFVIAASVLLVGLTAGAVALASRSKRPRRRR